jgi:hypothetical protein
MPHGCFNSLTFEGLCRVAALFNKTDAGNGSNGICRVFKVHPSPSPDPRRSANSTRNVKAIETDFHVMRQAGVTMRISIEPISADDWDDHGWRDQSLPLQIQIERLSVPVLPTEVVMWEGGDGDSTALYPHLHYTCPKCRQMQNVDLYDTDPNPRFACCDICGWDSIVWLAWDYAGPRFSQPSPYDS